jgi:hypothetical protein
MYLFQINASNAKKSLFRRSVIRLRPEKTTNEKASRSFFMYFFKFHALGGSPALYDVIHQSGRLVHIRRQVRLGVVSHSEASVTRNQLRSGLLGTTKYTARSMTNIRLSLPAPGILNTIRPGIRERGIHLFSL